MHRLAIFVSVALFALTPSAWGQDHEDAEAAIRAGSQQWAAAWNTGDAAALTALYTEDAVVMAPGAEPATGHAAIEESFRQGLEAAAGSQNKIKTLEVMTADGWAVETGTFVSDAADGSHLDHGRFVAVWKKIGDKWMLYRDIWNSSMPQ
jgi:uncharacterized protein (TIGR02246 family)